MTFIVSILFLFSVDYSHAVSKKVQCERIFEVVSDATILLMQHGGLSLAKYTSSDVGKKATKYFPGEKGEEIVALTYLLANTLNDNSLETIKMAKALLDKSGKKYKLDDLLARAYLAQQRKINDMTLQCVLEDSLKKLNNDNNKFDPNSVL